MHIRKIQDTFDMRILKASVTKTLFFNNTDNRRKTSGYTLLHKQLMQFKKENFLVETEKYQQNCTKQKTSYEH